MKNRLISVMIAIVMMLSFVVSTGISAVGATTLAAPTLSLKSYATKAVLSWSRNANADGYQIYWCGGDTSSVPVNNFANGCWNDSVKLATIAGNTRTSYTKTGLSYKKNYHFKVRAYKKSGSSYVFSNWSAVKSTINSVNRLNAATLKSKSTYNIINTQGSKNTVTTHTLTSAEKTILSNFAKSHFTSDMTVGDKIVYTAEWIRRNLEYGPIPTASHTYNIFKLKQGQCSDYNGALVEMMIYLGFDARLIQGYRHGSAQHFWGEVIIDGSVFLMEVGETRWDSPEYNYKWRFLCNTYAEADGEYYKNGSPAKDSIASYPAEVTEFKAASKTCDVINLSWKQVNLAAGYYIYQYNNTTKKWQLLTKTAKPVTSYKVSKLSAGTQYSFYIKAYRTANGQEITSATFPILKVTTNPATVTGFKVTAVSAAAAKLEWNAVKSAQGYLIYQYNDTKKAWTRIAKTTTTATVYLARPLNSGKKYRFAVKAYRTENGKEITSPAIAETSAITKLPKVDGIKSKTIDNSIKLSWNKISGANGYVVYRRVNGKWTRLGKIAANTYTVKNLPYGEASKFAVNAYKTVEGKDILSISFDEYSAKTCPGTVTGFKVKAVSAAAVKLEWNEVKGAQGYYVYQYSDTRKTWVRLAKTTNTNTTYLIRSLDSGKKYKYVIKAYLTDNNEELISSDFAETSAITKLKKVAGIKSTSTDNSIKLSWDKLSGANGYVVYQYLDHKWTRIDKITSNTYTVKNLDAGKTCWFAVRAYKNVDGKEILSFDFDTYKTTTNPAKTNFTVTAGTRKAVLKWTKVSGATGYIVYYKTAANGKWQRLDDTTATSFTKTGLTKGKTYYFTVKAYKKYNGSTYYGSFVSRSSVIK